MPVKRLPNFRNETYKDFSLPKEKAAMESAIKQARASLGKEYPLLIGSERIKTNDFILSRNPAHPSEIIGKFGKGTVGLAQRSLDTASKAFESWRLVDPYHRADILMKAAAICRRRRYEINAWMVLEVGKNYLEADADTAEAIDFLEFYAREMYRLAGHQPVHKNQGEVGYLEYLPLGVGVIVPPWNFPFAILVGTASAAIVTGNTIILKPSSDSPMMGWLFAEIMHEAGLPDGVLNFFTAPGGEIGDYLVKSPVTRFISFTGSKEIGLRITQLAATPEKGQKWIKRVVAEMGGKDGIVVAKDADVENAAQGIVSAAFGFQGQKCSACSRAIVERPIYDKIVSRVKELVDALEIGDPRENKAIGPVVNQRAQEKIMDYIKLGKSEGKLISGGGTFGKEGFYVKPTVFADIAPTARLAQEEIFGPVLAIIPVKDFDEALKVANNTEYGLTGAVYAKNRSKLDRAAKEFFVGNLYLNRKCTGALVGVHPFGGFNMSGTDSKAGGRDYLHLFLQARVVAEKVKELPKKKRKAKRKPATK
ncbi:MAG: L-glutamate gamma-semialdehyde dehydrogenase [Bacteroidota bacterium]|nr:L-glutamate gamma-semialdehyde dehydrogenase [Bacteroidota bacterium]MDP4229163.1 L-glutamate gamma-semialdehyde dehydrogenase [Bacteroidota bacterium]MDP4236342.1 L-glutamate gamma-semialdehyde dehydrogenase [Bacteroidota bacterium]